MFAPEGRDRGCALFARRRPERLVRPLVGTGQDFIILSLRRLGNYKLKTKQRSDRHIFTNY